VPQISWLCTSSSLSDKETYPSFARTVGANTMMAPVFVELCALYGWTRVASLTTTEHMYSLLAQRVSVSLTEAHIVVQTFLTYPGGPDVLVEKKMAPFMVPSHHQRWPQALGAT
jgi:hypothetical protein